MNPNRKPRAISDDELLLGVRQLIARDPETILRRIVALEAEVAILKHKIDGAREPR